MRYTAKEIYDGGKKAAAIAGAAYTAFNRGTELYNKYKEWKADKPEVDSYTVTIDEDNYIYDWLAVYLFESTQDTNKAVLARYNYNYEGNGNGVYSVKFLSDISKVPSFKVNNTLVTISSNKKDGEVEDGEDYDAGKGSMFIGARKQQFVLTVKTQEDFVVLKGFLTNLADSYNQEKEVQQSLWGPNKGKFELINWIVKRPMETVFLAENVLENLLEDLNTFFSQKDQYVNFGIPYHRGYLLHGTPGSGKTSLVKALSGHFNMNVYNIPLNDVASDAELSNLIGSVENNSIILIEDIDGFRVARERTDEGDGTGEGLSISGLLNALDGIQTLHSCIVIMTTNHPDALDSALLRPGRIDRKIEIGYVDSYQVTNMVKLFTGEDHIIDVNREVAPAEVIEVFKSNMRHPELAVQEVKELLS